MLFHILKETIATKSDLIKIFVSQNNELEENVISMIKWKMTHLIITFSNADQMLFIFFLIWSLDHKLHFLIQKTYQHRYRKRWNGLRNGAGQACDRHAQNCVLSSWFYVRCLLFAFPLPSDFILSLKYCERFPYDIQCKI